MDFSKPIPLSVKKLAKDFSFLKTAIWFCIDSDNPITLKEVNDKLVGNQKLPSKPRSLRECHDERNLRNRNYHVSRIAYLVKNPDSNPIEVDVGMNETWNDGLDWPICDGNHRLSAAIVRKDESILVNFSGSEREIKRCIRKYGIKPFKKKEK